MAAVPGTTAHLARSGPNPFSVGGLTFASIDCPVELAIGTGEQQRAVLKPVGGGKVVYETGFCPDVNTWKGTFHQPDIDTNVATLRRFMVDGKERLVTWRSEMYWGIVASFRPNYRKGGNVCDWQLDMEITRAANGAFSPAAPQASSDERIGTLMDTVNVSTSAINAASDAQAAAVQDLNVEVGNAKLAIQNARPTASAAPTAIAAALASVSSALAKANAVVAALPASSSAYFSARQAVAALSVIIGVLQSTQVQAIHQQVGGHLAELAATKYGDVSRWTDLIGTTKVAAGALADVLHTIPLPPYPRP